MPFTYSIQYREAVLARVRAGERVYPIAEVLTVNAATVFRWIRQDRVDRGEIVGTDSVELSELAAARKRIVELERELEATKRASELFAEGSGGSPKSAVPDR